MILSPGRKIENWQLNAQQEIVAPAGKPGTEVTRAIAAYQEAAHRLREGLLKHPVS